MHLRLFLTQLFNQLSDADRNLLHSNVGSVVSYQDQIDSTPTGSRRLLHRLFDQNIISDDNFDFLIELFEKIHLHEIVEKLQKYKQSRLYLPVSPQYVLAELDQSSPKFNTVRSTSGTCSLDAQSTKSLLSKSKRKPNDKRYLYWIIILLSVTLALTGFSHLLQSYTLSKIHITSKELNRMVKLPSDFVYFVKEGLRYGNPSVDSSVSFDDANDFKLTYADHCIGINLFWSNQSLNYIRFIYNNNNDSSHMSLNDSFTAFILNSNEEINKINIYEDQDRENSTIVGIQFHTTHYRKSQIFGSRDGRLRTEAFQSYRFAYAQGRQDLNRGIDMLKFFWIKQDSTKQYMTAVARPLVEMCEFTFISKIDFTLVHAKGIESSWYELKDKYERQGSHCHPEAFYYEKISIRGPQLFAIVSNDTIFYHDNDVWFKYRTADNIRCSLIPQSNSYQ